MKLEVQYFIGVISASPFNQKELISLLDRHFGAIDLVSDTYPFNQTTYYQEEMGQNLHRSFFSFRLLDQAFNLATWKKKSIDLEKRFLSIEGKRLVNLDPGYLDEVKVVLASTKKGGHKIALDSQIYADMVLDYYKGNFRSFD